MHIMRPMHFLSFGRLWPGTVGWGMKIGIQDPPRSRFPGKFLKLQSLQWLEEESLIKFAKERF